MDAALGFCLSVLVMMGASGALYHLTSTRDWYGKGVRYLLKGGTTLMAAMLAVYGAAHSGISAHWWLAAGLIICAAADVLLEVWFKIGVLAFGLGHLCYIRAMLLLSPFDASALWRFLSLAVICVGAAYAARKRVKEPPLMLLAYGLVLSFMLALALGQRPALAIGAALFLFSDSLIFLRLVFPDRRPHDGLCILTYWMAQYLIALSTVL